MRPPPQPPRHLRLLGGLSASCERESMHVLTHASLSCSGSAMPCFLLSTLPPGLGHSHRLCRTRPTYCCEACARRGGQLHDRHGGCGHLYGPRPPRHCRLSQGICAFRGRESVHVLTHASLLFRIRHALPPPPDLATGPTPPAIAHTGLIQPAATERALGEGVERGAEMEVVVRCIYLTRSRGALRAPCSNHGYYETYNLR
jgi:hypothetical protein